MVIHPRLHWSQKAVEKCVTKPCASSRRLFWRVLKMEIMSSNTYVHTDFMVADVLTKALSGMKYHRFKNALLKGASEI